MMGAWGKASDLICLAPSFGRPEVSPVFPNAQDQRARFGP